MNWLESVIGAISPQWGLRRTVARVRADRLQAVVGHSGIDKLLGGGGRGYDAAKRSRLTAGRMAGQLSENQLPRDQIQTLRNNSRDLYRNNPHARKVCRQIESKVIGRGLQPLPLATHRDGSQHKEFRRAARRLWREISPQLDYRGKPGRGGQHLVDLQKTAVRSMVLGGETFCRFRRLTAKQQNRRSLILPLQLQLIDPDRLDETKNGPKLYYGIEFNEKDERVSYHVLTYSPSDELATPIRSKRVWASDMCHMYVTDDIDQIRGTPWFSAALLKMRDVSDYEYNELQAAAMSACVVLGYRRAPGQTDFGMEAPDDWDLQDADGNKITNMSPGMILDLGQTGEIEGFNPMRPNTEAVGFINHMVRSEAASVPGIKSSSLTGDYRESSFSSERSADNDAWPELEGIQDLVAWSFCQPVYEEVITAAISAGYFDATPGFSARDFEDRRAEYLKTEWRGPVPRSINPKDDAEAALRRMKSFTSSPQREAADVGRSLEDILEDWEEFFQQAADHGIPEDAALALLGIQQLPIDPNPDDDGVNGADPASNGNSAKSKTEKAKSMAAILRGGLNGNS